MKLLRFDTLPYRPSYRTESKFPVLAGQVRCSTGVSFRKSGAEGAGKRAAMKIVVRGEKPPAG